jgi:UDP-N-acetylmuramoylalanine--D-glutamate ligase
VIGRPPLPRGPYLVVGLARSGIAAARALTARDERVIGVDAGALSGGTQAMRELAAIGVELHTREDGLAHIERVGALIKSPGVPVGAAVIEAAHARGLPVLGELELAWRLLPNEFIAVTGTNGKTTTVELIGHIHREAGLPVVVAGNVGSALSGLVGSIEKSVTVVCEASSFQLEDALAFAPEAAVLLNLSPDHLDRHGTFEAYRDAKLRIFAHQGDEELAVVPVGVELPDGAGEARRIRFGACRGADAHDAVDVSEIDCCAHDGRVSWQGRPLLAADELRLRGAHNVENAMAAAAVCLARGLDPDAVRAGLRSFAGVAHRLEEVARRDGVLYVNDSKATNVASTLVALQAFPPGRVHLILGGQGKGQDFAALREPVAAACRAVYLIGEDAPLIARALAGIDVPVADCRELEQAVVAARAAAAAGEIVLLSPACASFDQFADYEARGERFREIVSR